MKVVYNYIIPVKGYLAMTVFPFIFARKDVRELNRVDINHETIHGKQQVEMLWIFFFLWYCLEYVIRWICYGFDNKKAYNNISFEQEAYLNETDFNYVLNRKHFSWVRYLIKKSF